MRPRTIAAVVLGLALASAAQAQTLRNPAGTGTLGGPTRSPTGASATPAPSRSRDVNSSTPAATDRPPLGSAGASTVPPGNLSQTAPGHTIGVGPNGKGALGNGTGLGGAGPSVVDPSGANATATPQGLAGARSNGAATGNGSKAAPIGANGVRKVQ